MSVRRCPGAGSRMSNAGPLPCPSCGRLTRGQGRGHPASQTWSMAFHKAEAKPAEDAAPRQRHVDVDFGLWIGQLGGGAYESLCSLFLSGDRRIDPGMREMVRAEQERRARLDA